MSPDYFVSIINQSLPEPHASLLAGMLFGQKYSNMPGELYVALLRTGTLHVVALSGTNVSILMRIVQNSTSWMGRKLSIFFVLVTIFGFLSLVGLDPPIVRATIMGAAGAILGISGRRSWALGSLLVSGGIMLFFWPQWLYSLSFQLSFLATLGIILFDSPHIGGSPGSDIFLGLKHGNFFIKAKNIFVENLKTTIAAQILITPILVYNFGRISLVSPLANALTLWSVEFITIGGIILVIGGALFWPLGRIAGFGLWFLLEYFIKIVELMSMVPFGQISF